MRGRIRGRTWRASHAVAPFERRMRGPFTVRGGRHPGVEADRPTPRHPLVDGTHRATAGTPARRQVSAAAPERMSNMMGSGSVGGGRRRVTLWLSEGEWAAADAAARAAGVETGAVLREAAVRGVGGVVRDVSAGRVRLRRRSVAVPVSSPAAETLGSGPSDLGPVEQGASDEAGTAPIRASVPAEGAARAAAFRAMARRGR